MELSELPEAIEHMEVADSAGRVVALLKGGAMVMTKLRTKRPWSGWQVDTSNPSDWIGLASAPTSTSSFTAFCVLDCSPVYQSHQQHQPHQQSGLPRSGNDSNDSRELPFQFAENEDLHTILLARRRGQRNSLPRFSITADPLEWGREQQYQLRRDVVTATKALTADRDLHRRCLLLLGDRHGSLMIADLLIGRLVHITPAAHLCPVSAENKSVVEMGGGIGVFGSACVNRAVMLSHNSMFSF